MSATSTLSHVKIIGKFCSSALAAGSFDAIFSVSVLEHLPATSLTSCFDALVEFLSPQGVSIHCFDFILQGRREAYDLGNAQRILAEHEKCVRQTETEPFPILLERLKTDVETFFLSPQGHHHWRNGQRYADFPFRKVVSLQTIARRSPSYSAVIPDVRRTAPLTGILRAMPVCLTREAESNSAIQRPHGGVCQDCDRALFIFRSSSQKNDRGHHRGGPDRVRPRPSLGNLQIFSARTGSTLTRKSCANWGRCSGSSAFFSS